MKIINLHIKILKSIFLLLLLSISFDFIAQEIPKLAPVNQKSDSSVVRKKHDPTLASLMSAIVPGLGQAYNKKYWKIPIVYGALGGIGYVAKNNNDGYQKYKSAYLARTDTSASTIDDFVGILSDSNLESEMNRWRRARDFDIIIMSLVYVFNIIDASVDANLFDFDVSDDLSLAVNPNYMVYNHNQTSVGVKLTLNLK